MTNLDPLITSTKVTSVLRDDSKSYGKQFLLDGLEDTCWNSDSGLPQTITFTFSSRILLTCIKLMFQGGFVGVECDIILIEIDDHGQELNNVICTIYPEDINDLQEFYLSEPFEIYSKDILQLKFKKSSDFYGRITVYTVHFEGCVLDHEHKTNN